METERLILRPFEETEEDLALILALYSDPEIMCYVPYDLLNGEQAKAHLKRIAEEWAVRISICRRRTTVR